MKKQYFLFFVIFCTQLIFGQTELVRWTKSNLQATNIANTSSPNLAGAGGVTIAPTSWSETFLMISGLPSSSTIDLTKYAEFKISPASNYKLNLANFNLKFRNQGGDSKVEIRYSLNSDFSNPVTLYSATVSGGNWQTIAPSFNNLLISAGKTISIRLYVYNTYNNFHLSYTPDGGTGAGPNITGTVAVNTPTVPVANNDSYTVYKNNFATLNILNNDVSGTDITGITITQQPANGTLTVNGTANVTYKPATGYAGADTFKYKAVNATGASNEATVSLNVVDNANAVIARWNKSDFSPNHYNDNITVGSMTSTANLSYQQNINVTGYNAFHTTGWPDKNVQTIDKSKYIQFTISPKAGYKLYLSDFSFLCRTDGGDARIKIDYSLNSSFTTAFNVLPETTVNNSVSTISVNNFLRPIATDGQVVYLRVYVYNTWNAFQIFLNDNGANGPAFSGYSEFSSTAPIAYNDTVNNTVNNDIDINVLINDDYSNKINTLNFTQPSHGFTTLNADKTINYIPSKNYVGSDSFTYAITNEYGTSNTATVNINNNPLVTTPLIRWDQNNFTSTPFQSFINSTTMTTAGGVTVNVGGETNPKAYYLVSQNNGTGSPINTAKYTQFVLDNISTNKTIEPKTFSYIAKGTAGATYELRYSKKADFSDYTVLGTGTVKDTYTLTTLNFPNTLKTEPGEKIYIRLYLYNTDYVQYVFQYLPGGQGPEIDGVFYNYVYTTDDTIWLNPANPHWSNGTPTATKNAIVETAYDTTTYGNFESQNLTIKTGGTLTVNTGGYITVNGQIVNNNTAATSFVVEHNGNLMQKGTAVNTGNITVKKQAVIPKMGYNYWSSPVANMNLYQFSDGYNQATTTGTGTPWNRFYVYNEANDYFVTSIAAEGITLSSTSTFQPARGYAIRGKNSFPETVTVTSPVSTFQFNGVPQNGDINSYNLRYSNAQHGYNLVGNPYPSNISFDALYEYNKSKMFGMAYFWTNNDGQILSQVGTNYGGNNYAILNSAGGASATYFGYNNKKPNGNIAVGQGFIIQAKQAGKDKPLVFNNAMRTPNIANYYNKGAEKNRFWLEFKSPADINNEILIAYVDEATNGFDNDYDADLFAIGNDSFWSILEDHQLAIQSKAPEFDENDVTKVAIKASVAGQYTITLTERDGIFRSGQMVYLKDKLMNQTVNITEAPYVFNTNAGEYADRFEVVYKPATTLAAGNAATKGTLITKDAQNFVIKSENNLEEVSLYDTAGRLIYENKNTKKELLINRMSLPKGMYIIQVNSKNTTMTKKVLN